MVDLSADIRQHKKVAINKNLGFNLLRRISLDLHSAPQYTNEFLPCLMSCGIPKTDDLPPRQGRVAVVRQRLNGLTYRGNGRPGLRGLVMRLIPNQLALVNGNDGHSACLASHEPERLP